MKKSPKKLPPRILLCFRPETQLIEHSPTQWEIRTEQLQMPIRDITPGMVAAFRKLGSDGAPQLDLADLVLKTDGQQSLILFHLYLLEFMKHRMLCYRVCLNGMPLATLVPASTRFRFMPGYIKASRRYILSRFAYCRRAGAHLILESPLSYAHLILHNPNGAAVLSILNQACRYTNLSERIHGLSSETSLLLFELLHHAGALSGVDSKGRILEDQDETLQQWEFHDLLFHSRSRAGRHSNPYGRTDHFVGQVAPAPLLKPNMSAKTVDLYRPNIDRLRRRDIPFTRVLEDRRSQREHTKRAISVREIGEFLFRSARVREIFTAAGNDFTERVYPGSGAAYELELYLAVNRCKGISAGLYHYDPLHHRLCRLSGMTGPVEQLLKSAAYTVHAGIPQVLIIISARFQRMTWRYESIAYASILKDVGVLFQTLYLVATGMGLAACALGAGNSDLFAEATNTNYYLESSVGEFILGR